MSWELYKTYGGSDYELSGVWRNITGSPIKSAAPIVAGSEAYCTPYPGTYRFTVESSTTVSIAGLGIEETDSPLLFAGTRTITADGVTENLNLLPGWSVILNSGTQTEDVFEIAVGCIAPDGDSLRILALGPKIDDQACSGIMLKAKNTSGSTLTDCLALVTNAIRIENEVSPGRPFKEFYQTGILNPTPDEDLNGGAITFEENVTAGFNILINGDPVDIFDVTNGAMVYQGIGLVPAVTYRFSDASKYQSGTFVLAADIADTDTATIYVSDAAGSIQISAIGVTFTEGLDGVALTQSGQVAGTVLDDGTVTFYIRCFPPSGLSPDLNMRSFSLRMLGLDGSDIEYCGDYQGAFSIVDTGNTDLVWRIKTLADKYVLPRYSETAESEAAQHYSLVDGEYVEDDDGEFIEDPAHAGRYIYAQYESNNVGTYVIDQTTPNRFIPATSEPNSGDYPDVLTILAGVGVTFPTT